MWKYDSDNKSEPEYLRYKHGLKHYRSLEPSDESTWKKQSLLKWGAGTGISATYDLPS